MRFMHLHTAIYVMLYVAASLPIQPTNGEIVGSLAAEKSRLLKDVLQNYDIRVPPQQNASLPVNMSFYLHIVRIVNLWEQQEVLEVECYLDQTWNDFRLGWKPSSYPSVTTVIVPSSQIWVPDLILFNRAELGLERMEDDTASVDVDGNVNTNPHVRLRTNCALDLTRFPFDTQTCMIDIGSDAYDARVLNILDGRHITDDTYHPNPEWKAIDMTQNVVTHKYPCCPDVYRHVQFTVKLKRKTVYLTYVFILPAVILALLVPVQFLLPPNNMNRLTLGCTLLLGCLIIMFMIQSFLPDTHPTVPYIVQYYSLTFIWTAVSVICCILVCNMQDRGSKPVPKLIRLVFLQTLRKLVCVSEDNYIPLREHPEPISFRSLEQQGLSNTDHERHDVSKLESDVETILRHVSAMVHAFRSPWSQNSTDWYQLAIVFDRVVGILFTIVFVVYTCVLLG